MPSRADIEAGRAFVRLFLQNDMSRQLVRALRGAQDSLRNFGQSATALGARIAAAGVAAATPFALSVRTFSSFDDAIRSVRAVTQASEADFASLTDTAKRLGASTSFTASQVANLMTELGRAGFAPAQINEMTGAVLSLARATGTDATLAAGIMSASIRQFGMAATDAARVADILTATANKSFNSVEQLGDALSYAGPVAADFGMSMEDTLAILGGLGNVGIQASSAGNALRRLLTMTASEAKKMREIFGVSFVDAAGNARPLVDVLDEVNKATADLGTAERAQKFNEAFGLLGITAASATGRMAGSIRDLRDELDKAQGTADKTAAEMDAGLGGAFRILKSSIEGVAIAIGESLAPVLTDIVGRITQAAQSAIEWIKAHRNLVVVAAGAAAAAGALGSALIAAGVAAGIAAFAFGGFATIASIVLSPIGLISAALISGVAAWATWTDSGQTAVEGVKGVLASLLAESKRIFGAIYAALSAGKFALAFEIMKTSALVAFSEIAARVTYVFRTLIPGLVAVSFAALGKAWRTVVSGWHQPVVALWELFKATSRAAFQFVIENWKSQFQFAQNVLVAFWKMATSVAGPVFSFYVEAWKTLFSLAANLAKPLWELLKAAGAGAFKFVFTSLKSNFMFAFDLVKAFWDAFKGFASIAIQNAHAAFVNGFIVAGEFVRNLLADAFHFVAEMLDTALTAVIDSFVKVSIEAAKTVGKVIKAALTGNLLTAPIKIYQEYQSRRAKSPISELEQQQSRKSQEETARQRGLGEAALAGLARQYADPSDVLADFGSDLAIAAQNHGVRMANATRSAAAELSPAMQKFGTEVGSASAQAAGRLADAIGIAASEIDPALREFGADVLSASRSHMERVRAAGATVVRTIAPMAAQFAQAVEGLSSEARAAFVARFQDLFSGVKNFKDPEEVANVKAALASMIAEARESVVVEQSATGRGGVIGAAGAPGAPGDRGITGERGAAADRGSALTATYSAAAATISGYQGGGPQEEMASNIHQMAELLRDIGLLTKDGNQSTKYIVSLYERFLASFQVA